MDEKTCFSDFDLNDELQEYQQANEAYRENPATYTLDDTEN